MQATLYTAVAKPYPCGWHVTFRMDTPPPQACEHGPQGPASQPKAPTHAPALQGSRCAGMVSRSQAQSPAGAPVLSATHVTERWRMPWPQVTSQLDQEPVDHS